MLSLYLSMLDDDSEKVRFEQIYSKYKNTVGKIAMAILKDEELAMDAAHNAFVAIAKNIKSFPSSGDDIHERYYVQTVIRNHAINIMHQGDLRLSSLKASVTSACSDFDALTDEIVEKDVIDKIIHYIDSMSDFYRDVLTMRYIYELSVHEIADILDCPENTVRSQIRRGIGSIQQFLAEEGLT